MTVSQLSKGCKEKKEHRRTMTSDRGSKSFPRGDQPRRCLNAPKNTAPWGALSLCACVSVSVCVRAFTARGRFDLLQDAMSVVCGPKMCVFRGAHIVYLSECAVVS